MIARRVLIRTALLPGVLAAVLAAPATAASDTASQGAAAETSAAAGATVLSLQQAVEMAVAHSLDVAGARQDAAIARAQVEGPRGAFDPVFGFVLGHRKDVQPQASTLNAHVSESKTDTYDATFQQKLYTGASYEVELRTLRGENNNPFVTLSPNYTTDLFLTFTQPLLKGFGRDVNRKLLAQAVNNAAIADKTAAIQARVTAAAAINAYWELVFARDNLDVQKANLDLAEQLLRKNRIMVEVGSLAPLEVSQAESAVAQRKQQVIVATTTVGNAEDTLRQVMGTDEGSPLWAAPLVPADRAEFHASTADLDESLAHALGSREELSSAQLQVDSAQLAVDAAKDALAPQLDLQVQLHYAGLSGDARKFVDTDGDTIPDTAVVVSRQGVGGSFDQVKDRDFESWNASLNYRQAIFNRAARSDWQAARLTLERRRIDLAKSRQDVAVQVRKAVRDVVSARESITAATAARQLEEKTLDAEQKKFENGLSTNFEVLQIQTDLATSRSTELRALVDYTKAVAELEAARGTVLADYGLAAAP